MSLLISIIEFPENCTVAEASKTFGEQGGTIGRAADNYWVLSDPECFLSACHSEVTFEKGCYVLTDKSTNGTFLNGSREPMGKGSKVQLQDGDEIELSDYKFKIQLLKSANAQLDTAFPSQAEQYDESNLPQNDFISNDPFATGEISSPLSIETLLNSEAEIVDPLAVLENKQNNNAVFTSDSFSTIENNVVHSQSTHSDGSGVLSQSVIWPNSHIDERVIPEDWGLNDDDDVALLEAETVAVNSNTMVDANTIQTLCAQNESLQKQIMSLQSLKHKNSQLQEELKNIKKQFITYQKTGKHSNPSSADTSMISAMGLSVENISAQQIVSINKVVGEMVRETVKGMMQVLTSRSSVKNEFRMNITTIQPVENNPLKFSANVNDALENMFLKSGSSYKKPIEAITDGFQGIAEHQVAILAGIRAAFNGAVERFDPAKLEKRFAKQNQSYFKFLPLLKASQNWNQFIHYFNVLTDDMDNSFQYLFGDEFVLAYEDQLQKLLVARKSKKVVC